MNAARLTILTAVCLAAGACTASAVVLQEDAESVSELIDASVTATRKYYEHQGEMRFNYTVGFLAARPSCAAESPLLIKTSDGNCLSSAEKKIRLECKADSSFHADCDSLLQVQPLKISPQRSQSRQTIISLIAAIAAYQRTLARVLKDETFNTAVDLNNLRSRLNELSNKVRALRSDETSTEETDEELAMQVAVIGALVDLLQRADQDLADFAALETIVSQNGPAIGMALEALLKNYEKVDKPFADLLARQEIERKRVSYNRMSEDERNELEYEEREYLIRDILEPELIRLKSAARPDPLAAGLRGVIRSHKKLQRGFSGDLTTAQKKRIAEESQQQLKAAFSAMFSIVKLFT